jgi:hypothetical protein
MAISIKKLESFLSKHGMVAKNFYVTNKMTCIYIEVLIVQNLESFMLYIPSNLDLKIEYASNVFLINSYPINENGDLFDQYTNPNDVNKAETNYEEIDLQTSFGKKDVEKHFENRYNRQISISVKFVNKDLFRQIRRLFLCIPSPYKVILVMGNQLYSVKKDNKIHLYVLGEKNNEFNRDKYRKVLVAIDLYVFYDKIKNIFDDVIHIKSNIMSLLRKNFIKHLEEIVTNNNNKSKLDQKKNEIINKEEEYLRRTNELDKMLNDLLENERQLFDKKNKLEDQMNLTSSGINKDIEKLKIARQYEIKLFDLNETKKDLTLNILSLKLKYDNLILFADSFSFELVVMSESINNLINNMEI